jgi:uncharacterized protein
MKPIDPRDLTSRELVPQAFVLPERRQPMLTRRRFLVHGTAGLALAGLGVSGYGLGIEPLSLVVTRYKLTPPNWPSGFRLTIAVVADLHAGGPNMAPGHIREIVEVTNLLKPDVTLLLGDYFATHRFITERVPHAVWSAELARLQAPLGVWAIFGNHDWWHDIAGTREALRKVGIPAMENEAVRLGLGGRRFWLAGLGDQLAYRRGHSRFQGVDDLQGTLAKVTTEDPVILMAHEPDIFPEVPARVALTLSGHTHGGQIRIPGLWQHWVPSNYGARFAYGHVVEDNRHLIVSGGLGVSKVPVRLGVPPEVVHIELGA